MMLSTKYEWNIRSFLHACWKSKFSAIITATSLYRHFKPMLPVQVPMRTHKNSWKHFLYNWACLKIALHKILDENLLDENKAIMIVHFHAHTRPPVASKRNTWFSVQNSMGACNHKQPSLSVNGQAERMVKMVKKILKTSWDQCLALLAYWATPFSWCGRSLAKLYLGRCLRADISQTKKSLVSDWPYLRKFREDDKLFKEKQKGNFDKRYRAKPLPELPSGTEIWITTDESHKEGV